MANEISVLFARQRTGDRASNRREHPPGRAGEIFSPGAPTRSALPGLAGGSARNLGFGHPRHENHVLL